MAVTLIINPGSSSKKYALFRDGRLLVTYYFERVGGGYEQSREEATGRVVTSTLTALGFTQALAHVVDEAITATRIESVDEITRVGVRVVAPGTYFSSHRVITDEYIQKLNNAVSSAPLHIPHLLTEVRNAREALPQATIIGVSDSAFHTTIPRHARTFPLSTADAAAYDLFRFGYHGLSVASVVKHAPAVFGVLPERLVVCHIGSGMSMTAVKAGQSIDTTMGFAPGSGLFMGSRTGDIEPAVILELMRVKNLKPVDMTTYLQTQGGFMGQVGESDFRHLLARYERGDIPVVAAFDQCIYQFQKTLGAYHVALGGLDAVVLTATAAERSPYLRALLLRNLSMIGIELDEAKNDLVMSRHGVISPLSSPVRVAVMKTDEFGMLRTVTDETV